MDIRCDQLVKAIGSVIPGIANREEFEQADKLALDDGKLFSYNDRISVHQPLNVGGTPENIAESKQIKGVIDGRRLYNLLTKLSDGVNVSLTVKGDKLRVKSRLVSADFKMEPSALPLDEIDYSGKYKPLPPGFTDGLRMVASSCSRELSRPLLTCINLSGHEMIGSDTYRVAKFTFADHILPELLLPATTAEILINGDYQIASVAVGEKVEDGCRWLRFKTVDEALICTRTRVGVFPDLSHILAIEGEDIILPSILIEPIERARIFARREHRIDEEIQVTLIPKTGKRQARALLEASCDGVEFSEAVDIGNYDISASFKIHPEFLLATLGKSGSISSIKLDKTTNKIGFIGEDWRHIVTLISPRVRADQTAQG